jgi:hypothetical protein
MLEGIENNVFRIFSRTTDIHDVLNFKDMKFVYPHILKESIIDQQPFKRISYL